LADPAACQAMRDAGLALVANGRGAVARTLVQVAPHLPPVGDVSVG